MKLNIIYSAVSIPEEMIRKMRSADHVYNLMSLGLKQIDDLVDAINVADAIVNEVKNSGIPEDTDIRIYGVPYPTVRHVCMTEPGFQGPKGYRFEWYEPLRWTKWVKTGHFYRVAKP